MAGVCWTAGWVVDGGCVVDGLAGLLGGAASRPVGRVCVSRNGGGRRVLGCGPLRAA